MEKINFEKKKEPKKPEENLVNSENTETSADRAERLYEKEIFPIIRILKPDDVSLEEYEESVYKDLFESVRNFQVTHGKLVVDPEETMAEVKELINQRIRLVIKDARDKKKQKKLDEDLVRRARIVVLTQEALTDVENFYRNKDPDLSDLRGYITGNCKNNFLSESEMDLLLEKKYKTRIVNSLRSYMLPGSSVEESVIHSMSNSLIVALTQKRKGSGGDMENLIEQGLKLAEKGKYNNDTLEHLIAAGYAYLVRDFSEKFSEEPLEKMIRVSCLNSGKTIDSLRYSDATSEDYQKYVDLCLKYCTGGYEFLPKITSYESYLKNLDPATVEFYTKIQKDIKKITRYRKDFSSHEEEIQIIKSIISKGYLGLIIYDGKNGPEYSGRDEVFKTYLKENYNEFLEIVKEHDQEHLVLYYLSDADKKEWIDKLIKNGEEYKIVLYRHRIPEHFLDSSVFDNLANKNLVSNLNENLSRFNELPESTALEYIQNNPKVFLNNFSSFNVSAEFLQRKDVQDVCLDQFQKQLMKVNPKEVRVILDKVPFEQEKIYETIVKTIRVMISGRDPSYYQACNIVSEFPYIKKYLDTKEFHEIISLKVKKTLEGGSIGNIARILEAFPLPEEFLNSDELKKMCQDPIEKVSNEFITNNINDIKISVESFFREIETISKYIKIPEYVLQQKEKISLIYGAEMEVSEPIKNECAKMILLSKIPEISYENLLKTIAELKSCKRINSNIVLFKSYVSKFENDGNEEEKRKFTLYAEEIINKFPEKHLDNKNWEYLFQNYSSLPETELKKHEDLLNKYCSVVDSSYFSNFLNIKNLQNDFSRLNSYTPEQQDQMFKISRMNERSYNVLLNEEDYAENIIYYINYIENLNLVYSNEDKKKVVLEMFDGPYRDTALKQMNKEWQDFLNSDEKFLPPNLFCVSKIIDEAGGAGNLKHLEALGNLTHQIDLILQNPQTADRTKKEIKDLLFGQEKKFDKEKLSQDDRSEFNNLSNDILKAAPSLYSAFAPILESIPAKDTKIFIKEIFPFYQAQLVMISEIGNNDDVNYKSKELVDVRHGLKNIASEINKTPEKLKDILIAEKTRLIEIIKTGFKNRFELIKVPDEFSKENLRSIQNCIRYIGNINGRDAEREAIISFYLGLQLNGEWDTFRQGKKIEIEQYFSGKNLKIVRSLIDKKNEGYKLISEIGGVSEEKMPKFQEILQEDTISNMLGNVETVDVKLGNIKRNVEELADPDIYTEQTEKDLVKLLKEEGKLVGSVLAKTYSEVSGKRVEMSGREREIRTKISRIFGINNWTLETVKGVQDRMQPFSLVINMINKMEEEKVDENIKELQKRLTPERRVVEIFNRLGEEFKQESGAMALSRDLSYLESIIVKDDKKITPEEKTEVATYLDSIREKMKDLENSLDKVREYFNKINKSVHLKDNLLLKNRLADIEKIIYSEEHTSMIISHMTKDLNLIIENMRQCLGCMRKETNNDTNLAFGDYNKFYLMNQSEKEKGSISDEIVFFVPIKKPNGEQEMSFVMDRVYGSKTSDVLISNIISINKKYQALKKVAPGARLSISVSKDAMASVGLDFEILKKRLQEVDKNMKFEEIDEGLVANIPESALSDNYIEFGNGGARQTGERTFSGLIIR